MTMPDDDQKTPPPTPESERTDVERRRVAAWVDMSGNMVRTLKAIDETNQRIARNDSRNRRTSRMVIVGTALNIAVTGFFAVQAWRFGKSVTNVISAAADVALKAREAREVVLLTAKAQRATNFAVVTKTEADLSKNDKGKKEDAARAAVAAQVVSLKVEALVNKEAPAPEQKKVRDALKKAEARAKTLEVDTPPAK